ncbi:porin family protein [Psychroflexus sediminis]|uniref:Outer membrane protein beta-barrel domain-containing protein n=1 Tax=Psychroflexus sediminis TaxID=470826 RepID=A0A1G7YLL8_9FLAO|nr:porin family protein [Psychroflexus sediminis]SDG97401.1 Outer membrane protein beta-barrel domain-containing protein [Psychroflexus sediminis]
MKRIIKLIVIGLFFLSATNSNSQSLDLGIKGGINYASISSIGEDSRLGLTGGAFIGARFNAFAVQAEVLFSQQGGEFNQESIETDHALVPILLKFHFLRIFNLQAGPQFNFLVNDSDILESEKLSVSGAVGVGLSLGSSLSIDARYNYGFTDAFKGAEGKHRFISLALGFSFL